MTKNLCFIVFTLATLCGLVACDEGDIPEKEVVYTSGRPIKLTTHITGLSDWSEGFGVVLATFDGDEDNYDVGQLRIPPECEGKDTTLVWELTSKATSVELCLVSALRERIITFAKVDVSAGTDTIRLDAGRVEASVYKSVLTLFKNSCIRCHGEGGAAQLWLDADRAYTSLVNHPAYRAEFEGRMRVLPGDAESSVLHQMLDAAYPNAQDIGVNHKAIFRSTYPMNIIDLWINNGAKDY
mgnify:CR=1 FL=1